MNNLPMIANRVEEKIQDVQLVIQNRELRIFKTGTKEAIPKITHFLNQLFLLQNQKNTAKHIPDSNRKKRLPELQ